MTVKHAIIGCGVIAPAHAESIERLENAELVWTCDIIEERSKALAEKYKASKVTINYRDILADPEVDSISICTPHHLHAEMTIEAAKAGKHVLTEKPMAISFKEIREMIEATDEAGVLLGVIFQHRFHPVNQYLKKMLEDGKFGKILTACARIHCHKDKAYYDSGAWRGTWAGEGGATLINQAIHSIDLLTWFVGDVAELWGCIDTKKFGDFIETEDTAVASFQFANGALGNIEATTASHIGWRPSVEVFGTDGSFAVNSGRIQLLEFGKHIDRSEDIDALQKLESGDESALVKSYYGSCHTAQIKDFIDAVIQNRPHYITGQEGRRACETVLAVYESSKRKAPVRIEELRNA